MTGARGFVGRHPRVVAAVGIVVVLTGLGLYGRYKTGIEFMDVVDLQLGGTHAAASRVVGDQAPMFRRELLADFSWCAGRRL